MPLRPHQTQLLQITHNLGSTTEIIIFAAPGGGKSLCPVILSPLLANGKKQIWVVPRNSLKYQGEGDYQNEYFPTDKIARVADNSGDPFRGCDACLTTYQAIGANPEKWLNVCRQYDVMIILDEFHHLSGHGDWINAINPMVNLSFLKIFMTGTITRGDNTKVPFVPYNQYDIDFTDTDSRKWILYSMKQALKDGAILPFDTRLIDSSGSYINKDGFQVDFARFTEGGDQLRCAFKTEYAYHLLDITINHWNQYRKFYNWSKLLIVSPDIETAKDYLNYIKIYSSVTADIATSEDSTDCKKNIIRFKRSNWSKGALNCLVTVAVAYEGLSVPEVSHMSIMTLIRSIPWLEQCTARCTRNYPGKKKGYVFAPNDPKMLKALKTIDSGKISAASGEPPESSSKLTPEEDEDRPKGFYAGIEALSSEAHIDGVPVFQPYVPEPVKRESQSDKEHRLRTEINDVIKKVYGDEASGNKEVKKRIFWLKVKQLVNNGRDTSGKLIKKPLKEFTVKELEKVAEACKAY